MPEHGCLVISDITGYSTYLHDAELDHARDILSNLLQLLVDHTRSPLVILELEGDAVFSYAPAGSLLQGQTLLEIVETTYVAYRKALELMILNTSCTCNACRLLPSLDLKFFVHYGEFVTQSLAGHFKLVGQDVNLIHRLLKNSVSDATGLPAYAAYTQAAAEALGLTDLVRAMPEHLETYPDVGEVKLRVEDLHGLWQQRRNEVRIQVAPEEALGTVEWAFPVPPPILWDYLTDPKYRRILKNADEEHLDRDSSGRAGEGAVYNCVHGDRVTEHTILDWRPFEQYTTQETLPTRGLTARYTYQLEPVEGGTTFRMHAGRVTGPVPQRWVGDLLQRYYLPGFIKKGAQALEAQIRADLVAGRTVVPEGFEVPQEQIRSSAETSLGA